MLTKKELMERTRNSVPYPLGDEALKDFYDFLEEHKNAYSSVARLYVLARLQEECYDYHRILIFDDPKIQRAFKEMTVDLPEAFYDFTFKQ